MTATFNDRDTAIAQHIHIGCWLDDLPGTLCNVDYRGAPRVTIEADPAVVTDRLGTPIVFSGDMGDLYSWEHPEGFRVDVFIPRDAA